MKKALPLVLLVLAGCSNRQFIDCDGATETRDAYHACVTESRKAQHEAHRIVVKKYAAAS